MNVCHHEFIELENKLHSKKDWTVACIFPSQEDFYYYNAVICKFCLSTRVWDSGKKEWIEITPKSTVDPTSKR